mgnify:FL=1
MVKFGSDALNSDLKSLHLATKSSNGFSLSSIFAHLFPKGYPASVAPGYKKYAVGQAVAMTLSAAGGVLSTKALLVGLGIGASSAAPMAGALNWIIKDGIGQIGGIAFASAVSDKFDENPKRWRLLSSMAMDASAVLELCTPLFPTLFLPIAAAANIGKNVSFLASSASRASLNRSLAVHSNLADVTAKCGSQSIMASMLGTGLGLLIAGGIPGEYGTCGSSAVTGLDQHAALSMGCFLALSGGALTANYISLRHVPSTALTLAKLDFIFRDFWDQCATRPGVDTGVGDAARLLQPSDLSTRDIFVAVPPLYPEVEQSVGGSLLDSTARIEDVDVSCLLCVHCDCVLLLTMCLSCLPAGPCDRVRGGAVLHCGLRADPLPAQSTGAAAAEGGCDGAGCTAGAAAFAHCSPSPGRSESGCERS